MEDMVARVYQLNLQVREATKRRDELRSLSHVGAAMRASSVSESIAEGEEDEISSDERCNPLRGGGYERSRDARPKRPSSDDRDHVRRLNLLSQELF